jgi:hypothetical protein
MANESNLKPFKKGDARINRKGRPKSFDAFRELSQAISHEQAATKTGEPVIIDGHIATVAEMILRQWATSKDARLQQAFIEYAFGKPPQRQEVTGADGGAVKQEITVKDGSIISKLLPELTAGRTKKPPGETE